MCAISRGRVASLPAWTQRSGESVIAAESFMNNAGPINQSNGGILEA
jgi:hypothetical protein